MMYSTNILTVCQLAMEELGEQYTVVFASFAANRHSRGGVGGCSNPLHKHTFTSRFRIN